MRAALDIVEPGPFDPVPEARTIAVEGGADHLTYDFFAMRVRTSPYHVRQSANEGG
jgi:hypothetical protein